MRRTLICLGALTLMLGTATTADAQIITNLEQERQLRWPGTIPYDGEPFMQRYNYGTRGMFFLNGNSFELHYLDYLDRADRAKKFGYAMPVDPFFAEPLEEVIVPPGQAFPPPPAVIPGESMVVPAQPAVRIFGGFGRRWR